MLFMCFNQSCITIICFNLLRRHHPCLSYELKVLLKRWSKVYFFKRDSSENISDIGYVRIGYVRIGYVRIGYVRIGYVHIGYVHIGYVHNGYVHIGYVHIV